MDFAQLAALTIHDVKNRLALLAGRAEARGDRDTLAEALATAGQLTSLLTCYKAEQGWLGADIDVRQPGDLVQDLASETRRLTPLRIDTEVMVPEGFCCYDDNLVRLVLNNALQNALRHARSRVVLTFRADPEWLEFIVQDDGPGFPPALLAHPQAPSGISPEGTGLGLRLAGLVAGLHTYRERSGQVLLENRDGARFSLRLPR